MERRNVNYLNICKEKTGTEQREANNVSSVGKVLQTGKYIITHKVMWMLLNSVKSRPWGLGSSSQSSFWENSDFVSLYKALNMCMCMCLLVLLAQNHQQRKINCPFSQLECFFFTLVVEPLNKLLQHHEIWVLLCFCSVLNHRAELSSLSQLFVSQWISKDSTLDLKLYKRTKYFFSSSSTLWSEN